MTSHLSNFKAVCSKRSGDLERGHLRHDWAMQMSIKDVSKEEIEALLVGDVSSRETWRKVIRIIFFPSYCGRVIPACSRDQGHDWLCWMA